jgi:lysophospholipase L1-like esterase
MISKRRIAREISRPVALLVLLCLVFQPGAHCQNSDEAFTSRPIEEGGNRPLLNFYRSLERASRNEWVARVLHYGDSHVAADILTGALRRQFQTGFGDGGAGFVVPGHPWPGYHRSGVSSQASTGWQTEGLTESSVAADDRLGLGGVSLNTRLPSESITLTAAGAYFTVYALKQPGGGAISISLDGVVKQNASLKSTSSASISLAITAAVDAIHTLQIRTLNAGPVRIFGIVIERNRAGVTYDALGINGARASRLLMWNRIVFEASLSHRDPDLIVVAYGSNEVGDQNLDFERYEVMLTTLLRRLREAAPRASLLVIGLPDRATSVGGKWKTISQLPALVQAQRQAAFEAGAAFYDLFDAMGGSGSIARWATLGKPLAQPDRVHLTADGYRLVADWIFRELMNGYEQTESEWLR